MLLFSTAIVAALSVVGSLAAPNSHVQVARRSSPNSSGQNGGFFYQFWNENSQGSVTYQNKAAGEFAVSWQDIGDFTSGKGWQRAAPRNVTFSGNVSTTQGQFYLAVYTWSPEGENYILENHGSYNPCSASTATQKGTLTSDGSVYQVCTVGYGSFLQNWSIRQNKRSSGTVNTANHYNYYTSQGMTHNPLSRAAYQILSVEGFGSSGSADITVS